MKNIKTQNKYRKFSYITDVLGIKTSLFDMYGIGFPKQPKLNKEYFKQNNGQKYDENWFINAINKTVLSHEANKLDYPFIEENIFDEPIVGFVKGDDPIFSEYKKIIGPFHFTPEEIMTWQANNNGVKAPKAEDIGVVSYILPISMKIKEDEQKQTNRLSERWAHARRSGEIFSQILAHEITSHLMDKGILAVVPDMTPMFNFKKYPDVGWASPWSQRHIAYAAGLGTFGINDLLITKKGTSHRCGSFVVNLKLEPDREREKDIHAYCLQYQGINCLKCKDRCPVNAVTENGHIKEECGKRVISSIKYCNKNYHIFIYGCGLCSTKIPCEFSIPKQLLDK